jgi:SAM-dependent methyltransferase
MWLRLLPLLRCPLCEGPLGISASRQSSVDVADVHRARARALGLDDERFAESVEEGLLLCSPCSTMFPIVKGLPVLLPYATPLHAYFKEQSLAERSKELSKYHFPDREAAAGERMVMESFSKEWLDYDYDGVIWEMSYADHEQRFLQEVGPVPKGRPVAAFLEIGCGLGITTHLANKNFGCDAVGLDLSLAALKASQHYRTNPFLHFVQASAFAIPLKTEAFDLIYSRGVLHHTYSTRMAFEAAAPQCRRGGSFYLWVYGLGSINETLFRRLAYQVERVTRPIFSRKPNSGPARLFLGAMALGYMAFNSLRRLSNRSIQPLTFSRAVHAARDRFTPQFAHRHAVDEVVGWFEKTGFERIEVIDWKRMPPADFDDYRRNVGVRGIRR